MSEDADSEENKPWTHYRAQVASLVRSRAADDPELIEARRNLRAARRDRDRGGLAVSQDCDVPRCDGTELGHDLAVEFPEETRQIDEALDSLRGRPVQVCNERGVPKDECPPHCSHDYRAFRSSDEQEHG